MRKIPYTACFVVLAASTVPALAQDASKPAAPATTARPTAAQPVAPEIRQALERMAEAMKAMNNAEIKADMTSEEVLDNGLKIENSGVLTISARRPDRLFLEVNSERKTRQFIYDGKQLTIYGPKTGYYATVAAPATTAALMDDLSDRYGIDTPLADLFVWGAKGVKLDKVQSSFYAGPDRIAGQVCEHYAFRQPGVDWQIWIQKTGQPLPCKIVMVNTEDPANPQTSAIFHWTIPSAIADSRFQFTPPANAHKIPLTPLATATVSAGGQP